MNVATSVCELPVSIGGKGGVSRCIAVCVCVTFFPGVCDPSFLQVGW